MNTIQLQENVSFETYQKIVKFINGLGVKIKNTPSDVLMELSEEDLKNIEISHLQAERGEMLDSSEVFERMRKRYED